MSPRPLVFISAVSRELKSARQLVANTLTFLGYQPVWQEIFGTESGDLREILRHQIDNCKGVVQLVGQCYGVEPPTPDAEFGRVSYTQYEALYARKRGKKVWYLFIDETFPIDTHEPEPKELHELQLRYRRGLQSDAHVFHALTSSEGLEASVLKLRDDLTRLRRGVKQWAVSVGVLLLISVALGVWILQRLQQTSQQVIEQKQTLTAINEKLAKLQEGVMNYAEVETRVRQSQAVATKKGPETQAAIDDGVYAELARQLKIDPKLLREKLPKLAEELKRSPNASSIERANAAYVAKDYAEAEHLALQATDEAKKAVPPKSSDALASLKLAGLSAQRRIQYPDALEHFREAEKLTDRERSPQDWAEVQYAIADLLLDQGHYKDAENILQSVVEVRTQVLGAEHPDTLSSRDRFFIALWREGQYAQAEEGFHQVVKLQEKFLGPEHPDTLKSLNNLAVSFEYEGKYVEAEAQFREVIKLEEKVVGPEHPDTLRSRSFLADSLDGEGKYVEAEAQYREVIKLREKVLGPEHPETLSSRNNFAIVLGQQGKYVEAEGQDREVLKLRERVLGPEHPHTLASLGNVATDLYAQGKYAEAEAQFREVIKLREKVLGFEHPDTLMSLTNLGESFDAQGKHAEAEAQFREVIKLREKVLGPEHPDTLQSRSKLAKTLMDQGKDAAAAMREVIKLREKVIGPEHPDTLESCYDFAVGLKRQGKTQEAKEFAKRAAEGARKVLGPDYPSTHKYEKLLQELEAKR